MKKNLENLERKIFDLKKEKNEKEKKFFEKKTKMKKKQIFQIYYQR